MTTSKPKRWEDPVLISLREASGAFGGSGPSPETCGGGSSPQICKPNGASAWKHCDTGGSYD